MYPRILCKLRMKCCHQMAALLDQHGVAFIFCQNIYFRARAADDRCADEYGFHVARARALLETPASG